MRTPSLKVSLTPIKSGVIFYALLFSMLLVHTMDANAQNYTSTTQVQTREWIVSSSKLGPTGNYKPESFCMAYDCSKSSDGSYTWSGPFIDEDAPKIYCQVVRNFNGAISESTLCSSPRTTYIEDCPEGYESSGYAEEGYECVIEGYDGPPPYTCDSGEWVETGSSCGSGEYYCESGIISDDGIGGCDVEEPDPDIQCYNGQMVHFANECPEFEGDPAEPEAEPNGVCESANYSQFSTDPDCQAPPPSPCTGECGDPTTPGGDHDNDGIPNEDDVDADSDGDGIPNGTDNDWVYTGPGSPGSGESGEEGGSATGYASGNCQQAPQCSDNSVECAILRQEWEAMCLDADTDIFEGLTDEEREITMESSIDQFKVRIEQAELITGLNSFFTIPAGGACPVWNVDVGWTTITIDHFCSDQIPWAIIAGVILACASYAALRIAFT